MAGKRIASGWQGRYRYYPVLLETFVESPRFLGTCYRAANWTCVSKTRGKGKLGKREGEVPTKRVWLYPLAKGFRSRMTEAG